VGGPQGRREDGLGVRGRGRVGSARRVMRGGGGFVSVVFWTGLRRGPADAIIRAAQRVAYPRYFHRRGDVDHRGLADLGAGQKFISLIIIKLMYFYVQQVTKNCTVNADFYMLNTKKQTQTIAQTIVV